MDYFVVRKTLTAMSVAMLGASLLIFLFALLIPLQREFFSQEKDSETAFSEPALSFDKNPDGKPVPERRLSPGVHNKADSSGKPSESKGGQNDTAIGRKRKISGAIHSLQASSQPPLAQILKKPPATAAPPAPAEADHPRRGPTRLLILSGGSFSPGVAKPEAKAQEAIDKIIPLIQARPSDKVVIEGHADKSIPGGFTPSQAWKWNKIISMLRAKAIAQLLKQKGVAGDRIIVKGLGDAVPLVSNRSKAGRSKNRRVEIKLLPARH
jgi:outer membrane protein OmpA-like peptidoglycan-associated protein